MFKGVYDNIKKVPGYGYHNAASINEFFEVANGKLNRYLDLKPQISSPMSPISNLLPLIFAVMDKKKIKVLDYGGGMGATYIDSLYALKGIDVEYHILDLKLVVECGMKIFPQKFDLHFHTDIPNAPPAFDVIYLGSCLQYIDDYGKIIQQLINLSPKYIFITDNFMGKTKTYATAQVNMKNRRIAYWIFRKGEIINLFSQHGYQNIYKSVNYQPFHNFDNFTDEYKVNDSCNLLFLRQS